MFGNLKVVTLTDAAADRIKAIVGKADKPGAGLQSVDRKAAGVAKGIQHFFVMRVLRQQAPVFTLIEEKAGLLAAFPPVGILALEHVLRGGLRLADIWRGLAGRAI